MEFLGQGFQKLEHEQDRQTDRREFAGCKMCFLKFWLTYVYVGDVWPGVGARSIFWVWSYTARRLLSVQSSTTAQWIAIQPARQVSGTINPLFLRPGVIYVISGNVSVTLSFTFWG